ncbi:uncharacterized protein [Watersipora subatra]|uniref:uncharacterized protein n=1 Tax=Watersipora subatra TaxID=2589382 RepID=UPI00355BC499
MGALHWSREEEEDVVINAYVLGNYRIDERGRVVRRSARRRRRMWMSLQSRTPSWYDNVLLNSEDSIWIANLRLPRGSVENLCTILAEELSPADLTVREPLSLMKRVCIALYKLASCAEYRAVAAVFGVSTASVHIYLHRFTKAICKIKSRYIQWYTTEEAIDMAAFIEQNYKYPQAIGAIDGSHIPVKPPLDGKADYICRKGYPSIVLQGVVDGHYRFRDVYVNTPGSAHDAAGFARSPLSRKLEDIIPTNDKVIDGGVVPLHLIGDPAYPMSSMIVKGYIGAGITPEQDSFNVYQSSARICVEIAFGKLKSRWRILQKRIDVDTHFAPMIITACCILHNMCENLRVPTPETTNEDQENERAFPQPENLPTVRMLNPEGARIRERITNFLGTTQPLRRSFRS